MSFTCWPPAACESELSISANPPMVTWLASIFIDRVAGSMLELTVPFAPIFMVELPFLVLIVMRIGPSGPSICLSPGASGAFASIGLGASGDSFIFGPPLPTTSASTGPSLLSRCSASLNRSSSSACSIMGTSSLEAPSGNFAIMSNRWLAIQSGPVI